MKKIRAISIILLILIIVTGACGCMKINQYSDVDKEIKSELMQYAVTQYSGVYEEVFYETAADATQNYVLCLKDEQGRVFNVYEQGKTGKRTDDYKNCIVDVKMSEYLMSYLGLDIDSASISVIAIMNIDVDVEKVESMTLDECIEQFGLYSLVFVCHFDEKSGSISSNGEALVNAYQKLRELDTDTVDFNVVVTSGESSDVTSVLQNMRHKYSGSWYSCESVKEYISEANPKLDTLEDLNSLVKE